MTSGGSSLPPADFHDRDLPISLIRKGRIGRRTHDPKLGALWFGPSGADPRFRFDDPRGEFKVCYIGSNALAAFAETFLRDLPTRTVSEEALKARAMSTLLFVRNVKVARAHGGGLAQLGTKSDISSGSYSRSQAWSRAIYEHKANVDGIEYRASHDDAFRCLALFDRARDAVKDLGDARIIWNNRAFVMSAIRRYRLELL